MEKSLTKIVCRREEKKLGMIKFRKIFGLILYKTIGRILPEAHCRIQILGRISKRFRGFCGKLILDKCGQDVNIYRRATFSTRIEIGDHSDIGSLSKINGKCFIGKCVIMGPECTVYTRNHRFERLDIPIKYQGNSEEMPVVIGDDVWIGYRVTILPGVHIGNGSVIGAGAVVAKDIPPYSIAVGNPIRIVKTRRIEGDD